MGMIDPHFTEKAIWIAGIATCKLKNWDITATLMSHALYGGGSALTFNNDSDVSKTIRKSSEYKTKIAEWIKTYKSNGKRTFITNRNTREVEFKSNCIIKDLYVSFGAVEMKGEIRDDGNLYVEINDDYDFDNFRFFKNKTAPNAANDYGKILLDSGIIKEFKIIVKAIEWAGKPTTLGEAGIDKFIAVAKEELKKGFKENNGNNITPYGAWYGLNGEPWCAMFVSWCANKAGIIGSYIPMYAYCPYGVNWYEGRGKYRRSSSGYAPNPGDVIMFQSGGVVSHTGIVTNYGSNTVTTIEGNSGDAVVSHQYNINNTYIHGYGVSDGSASGSTVDSSTLLRMGSAGDAVRNLQTKLIAKGYNCGSYGADGTFGQGTYNAVLQLQKDHGLSADGIAGSDTWNALLNNSANNHSTLLRMGSAGSDVKSLQNTLISHGYNCGSYGADGTFGQGTYNAVLQLQKDHGLSADGIVGSDTWNALLNNSSSSNSSALLKIGSRGTSVRNLQNALIARGYSCGSYGADGAFGQGAYNAVVKFQKDHGLSADGIVGSDTWNALLNNSINNYSTLLRMGSKSSDVKTLQNALIAHGYSCGSTGADGDFGQGTYNAVVKIQNDHGLSADGIVGPATWNALSNSAGSNSNLLRMGSKGDLVRNLQNALIARGYSCGSYGADGAFGQGAYNAVVKFQKDHGLSADGIVGPGTWNALNNTTNKSSLLRVGSKGDAVKTLQNALIAHGYNCGSYGADGAFGQGTYDAVVKLQKDHGLSADGIVGSDTWNAFR